jgi:hypothetical protein
MAEPKDRWDKTDIFLRHFIGVLLPLALFILANAVRDSERAESRAQAVANIVANASKATTEDQLEMAVSPLASYGADAAAPLEAMTRAQYKLWFNSRNTEAQPAPIPKAQARSSDATQTAASRGDIDASMRHGRVLFLATQMSYLGERGAESLIRLVESQDIGVSGQGITANCNEDPIAEALDDMAAFEPNLAIPPLIRALNSSSNQQKDTYAVILRNKNNLKLDEQMVHALLDSSFDPHGGEDAGPHWYTQCIYTAGTLISGMVTKPIWAEEQLRKMQRNADALSRIGHDPEHQVERDVKQAIAYALGELKRGK